MSRLINEETLLIESRLLCLLYVMFYVFVVVYVLEALPLGAMGWSVICGFAFVRHIHLLFFSNQNVLMHRLI